MQNEIVRHQSSSSPKVDSPASAVLDDAPGVPGNVVFAINLRPTSASPLALRPRAEQSQALAAPELNGANMLRQVRVILHDGAILVNGREMRIPAGLAGPMTGRQFKRIAGIYSGNALFIQRAGGMQRVRDSETVDIVPESKLTHRRELSAVSSMPRFGRD